jgi:predicted RNA-binding Zn ribbon-like protein
VNPEDCPDPLAGPDDLEGWCAGSDLCRGTLQGDFSRLRAFREALRGVLEANAGTRDAPSAWASLEPFAREASYGMRIDATGPPALEPAGHGAERTIAALLVIVYDAMRRGTWSRLRACRKPSCRWAYYDRSKNGSGAWCDMATCGNRMKAKRRRQKSRVSEP